MYDRRVYEIRSKKRTKKIERRKENEREGGECRKLKNEEQKIRS